jgi:hypothetical protein
MDIDRDHIDEAILALLFLGRHDGKAKSVLFTDEGLRQSEALFRKLFAVGREV